MNIGEAAAQAGLPAKTIRYYEDIGLIRSERDSNGYRTFSESSLHKLTFLSRARALGFTIEDCRTLLALGRPIAGKRGCEARCGSAFGRDRSQDPRPAIYPHNLE